MPTPGYSHKVWKDQPDHTTPISAAALEDLEDRVTQFALDTASALSGQFKGVWNSGTAYSLGNGVSVGTTNYISTVAGVGTNTNHNPVGDDGSHWTPAIPSSVVTSIPTGGLLPVPGVPPVANVQDPKYGAKADAVQATGGAITSGTNTLSISGGFVGGDVNKFVMVPGAGASISGVPGPFTAYIGSVVGGVAHLVTTNGGGVAANAGNTVSSATVTYGTGCSAAVLAANADGYRVHMPIGSYIWDTSMAMANVPHLTGDGPGRTIVYFTSSVTALAFDPGSGLVGSTGALTANAAKGASSLTIGGGVPAGLAPGDYLLLSSTTVFDAVESSTLCGEFCRVFGISGTTIFLNSPVLGPFTYTTAASAKVQKVQFTKGAVIRDLEFINGTPEINTAGAATPATTVASADGGNLIWLKRCLAPSVRNLQIRGWAGDGVAFINCIHHLAHNVNGHDGAVSPAGAAGNSYGYLIAATGSQWGVTEGGSVENSHGFFNASGAGGIAGSMAMPALACEVWNAVSRNGMVEPYITHNASAYIHFHHCTVSGGAFHPPEHGHYAGFQIQGHYCRLIDPIAKNVTGRSIGLTGDHCEAIRPYVRDAYGWDDRAGAIDITGTNCKLVSADIDGVFNGAGTGVGRGVYVQIGATGFEMSGKSIIRNTDSNAIFVEDTSNTETIDGVLGINNTGYVINSAATNPSKQWSNIRAINPTIGIVNKPTGLVSSTSDADRLFALKRGSIASYREPFDVHLGVTNVTITSGTIFACLVPVLATDGPFTKILFSTTGAATFGSNNDGHWWVALYDDSGTLIVQSNDQGVGAIAGGGTLFSISLQSSYTPAADALIRATIMVYLGTGGAPVAPTIRGNTAIAGANMQAGMGKLAVTGSTGQTSGTAPGAFGATTATNTVPYLAMSS